MERHHEMALLQALDQLYIHGAVSIQKDYLYLWFNAERLTVGVYREIAKKWEDLCVSTLGYEVAPDIKVLDSGPAMLNLRREPFEGEREDSLSKWT